MFKKAREARAVKRNKPADSLVQQQETAIKALDEEIATVLSKKDDAEKILALQALEAGIREAREQFDDARECIVNKRVDKKQGLSLGAGVVIGGAAVSVPLAIFAAPLAMPVISIVCFGISGALAGTRPAKWAEGRFERTAHKQIIEQNPLITYFGNMLAAQENRVSEACNETIMNCDLEKLPLSPHFKNALDSSVELKDRFTQAAIDKARQSLEEDTAQKNSPPTLKLRARNLVSRPTLKKQ